MSKKHTNPMIHAAQVPASPKNKDGDKPAIVSRDRTTELISVASKVAGDSLFNRNWPWKNARIHFAHFPLLRTVDKYYPNAKGGPLYIDEPITKEDEDLCEKKRPKILAEKLRYLVINRETTEHEALNQLKGIDGLGK